MKRSVAHLVAPAIAVAALALSLFPVGCRVFFPPPRPVERPTAQAPPVRVPDRQPLPAAPANAPDPRAPNPAPTPVPSPDPEPTPSPPAPPARRVPGNAIVVGHLRGAGDSERLGGVRVTLAVAPDDVREATTDAEGAFRFEGVPVDVACEVRAEKDGCATVRLPVELSWRRCRDGVAFLDVGTLRLGPPVSVQVHVRNWSDRPAAGAVVEAFRARDEWGPPWSTPTMLAGGLLHPLARATTDGAGDASFDGLAEGRWAFTAAAAGLATDGVCARIGPGPRTPVTLRIDAGSRLEGRVVEADGSAVPGATVVLCGYRSLDSAPPLRTRTDEDGRFGFDPVVPGDHVLCATRRGETAAAVGRVITPDISRYGLSSHLRRLCAGSRGR